MKVRKNSSAIGNKQGGFVIVPVLWILLMLASLAGVLSVYLANSAIALALNDDRLRTTALVTASLELTVYKLASAPKQTRPQSGSFVFRLDHSRVLVRFSSEASRIDLNLAPKELLANLFQVLGAQPKDAGEYADRIIGWRAPQPDDTLESENTLYRGAGARYLPRSASFPTVQELWLVLGLPPALVERAMQFVTVFSGRREINVFEAAPEVVASVPGMTPSGLAMFLKERQTLPRDIKSVADFFGAAQTNVTVQGSDAVRVITSIEFENGRRSGAEVVITVRTTDGGGDPYRILSWRDDAEIVALRKPSGESLQ
jgi:general secretion pathway protein K